MEALPIESEKPYVLDNPYEDLGSDVSDDQEIQIRYYDTVYTLPLGAVRYSITWRNLIKDTGLDNFIPDPENPEKEIVQLEAMNPISEFTPEQTKPLFEDMLALLRLYAKNPPDCDRHTFGGEDHEVLDTKLSEDDKKWANYDKEYDSTDLDRMATIVQISDHLDVKEVLNTCCQIVADKLQNDSEEELIKKFKLTKEQLPTEAERKELEEKYAFLKAD